MSILKCVFDSVDELELKAREDWKKVSLGKLLPVEVETVYELLVLFYQ